MLHPQLRLRWIDDDIGYGIFAAAWIPTGTILWALDELDLVLPVEAARRLGPRYSSALERYGYRDAGGATVVCWDFAKYMNHSCQPNCVGPGHGLFDLALRALEPGDEVTTDYGCLNIERSMRCLCRSPRCRGTVRPTDLEPIAAELDRQVGRAIAEMRNVPQALRPWVDPDLFQRTVNDLGSSPSVAAFQVPAR